MTLTRAQVIFGALTVLLLIVGAYAAGDQLRPPERVVEKVPVIVYPDPTAEPGVLTPDIQHDTTGSTWPVGIDTTEHTA